MKVTPRGYVPSGSALVRLGNSAPDGSEESLFSLLLKVETRLRAGTNDDSQDGLGRHKSPKKNISQRSFSNNLSRYIE
jgi:hypothetical protein